VNTEEENPSNPSSKISLISKFSSTLMMSTDLISSIPAVKVPWEACTSCFAVEVSSGPLISPKDV